jgi:hypothetical protein
LLSVAGLNGGFDHLYRAQRLTCELCSEIHGRDAGSWVLIDPADQVSLAAVDLTATSGLQLAKVAPAVRFGIGRIELRIGNKILGDIALLLCPVDKIGVVEKSASGIGPSSTAGSCSPLPVLSVRATAGVPPNSRPRSRPARSGPRSGTATASVNRSTAPISVKSPDGL